MRRFPVVAALAALLILAGTPPAARAQVQLDPRRAPRFMIDASLAYVMITGEVGDSLKAGPGIDASVQYQLGSIPLRLGAGAGYSRHGLEEPVEGESVSGTANKYSIFALASLLLFSDDTEAIPYVQARVGYTTFDTSADGLDSKRGGVELVALVGVELPLAEKIAIDVSGLFGWISTGDATADDVTVPNSSASGSMFSIRAGFFFFL